ncbi:MAG: transporter, partial [Alphaproteobacteria bacterium]|nr:transporter [Alphaproteobacteria bacterium]
MKHYIKTIIATSILASTASLAFAGPDNTLFNPTPTDKMRAMTTERPSKTDSPFSLDAGHFQLETNLFSTVHNNDCIGGSCVETNQQFYGGATNLRIGLTDYADLQIISDLYRHVVIKDKTAGTNDTKDGFGDTQVRLKFNVLGNDPSSTFSVGVIPYVKTPTNQNDLGNNRYEGGIGVPFNVNVDGGWSLGGMTQLNFITEPDLSGYDPVYVNSLIVG